MSRYGSTSVSSLLNSARTGQNKLNAYNNAISEYTYSNSAKTADDLKTLQDHYSTQLTQANAQNPAQALSIKKNLDAAYKSHVTNEISRTSLGVLYGSQTDSQKYDALNNFRNQALANGDQQQALSLETQMAGLNKTIQNAASASAKSNKEAQSTADAQQYENGISQFKQGLQSGHLTADQFVNGTGQLMLRQAQSLGQAAAGGDGKAEAKLNKLVSDGDFNKYAGNNFNANDFMATDSAGLNALNEKVNNSLKGMQLATTGQNPDMIKYDEHGTASVAARPQESSVTDPKTGLAVNVYKAGFGKDHYYTNRSGDTKAAYDTQMAAHLAHPNEPDKYPVPQIGQYEFKTFNDPASGLKFYRDPITGNQVFLAIGQDGKSTGANLQQANVKPGQTLDAETEAMLKGTSDSKNIIAGVGQNSGFVQNSLDTLHAVASRIQNNSDQFPASIGNFYGGLANASGLGRLFDLGQKTTQMQAQTAAANAAQVQQNQAAQNQAQQVLQARAAIGNGGGAPANTIQSNTIFQNPTNTSQQQINTTNQINHAVGGLYGNLTPTAAPPTAPPASGGGFFGNIGSSIGNLFKGF